MVYKYFIFKVFIITFIVTGVLYSEENDKSLEVTVIDANEVSAKQIPVKDEKKFLDKIIKQKNVILKNVDGYIYNEYRYRMTDSEDDSDFTSTLGFSTKNDSNNFHFLGRTSVDIDNNSESNSAFSSISDTYNKNLNMKVYSAYFNLNSNNRLSKFNLGRQSIYDTPESAFFDGMRIESKYLTSHRFKIGLYGGKPVHLYESSSSGDQILGAYAIGSLSSKASIKIDQMRIKDAYRTMNYRNDLTNFRYTYRYNKRTRFSMAYSMIDNLDRDINIKVKYINIKTGTSIFLTSYLLINGQQQNALEFSSYQSILQSLEPYYKTRIYIKKKINDIFSLDTGLMFRTMKNIQDKGTYNREYHQYHVGGTFNIPGKTNPVLSINLEQWDSDNRVVHSYGIDYQSFIKDKYTVGFGSYFSLYKYDIFLNSERDEVQTYHAFLKVKLTKALNLRSSYSYENDDYEAYHIVKIGVRCHF
jgi:hypothetical protein